MAIGSGRPYPADGSGGVLYDYFLRDHLGNTRMMLAGDGTVLEETSYYPFGLTQKGISTTHSTASLQNKYLYNGKELQQDLGLDQYDYGARFYDAQIGRWHVQDPLSEIYKQHSVYTYILNNPIFLTDPDGMSIDPIIVGKVLETVVVFAVRSTQWWKSVSIPALGPIRTPSPALFLVGALLLPSNWNQKPYVERIVSQEMQDESLKRYIQGLDKAQQQKQEQDWLDTMNKKKGGQRKDERSNMKGKVDAKKLRLILIN